MKITVLDPRPISPEEQARAIGLSSLVGHALFDGLSETRLVAAFGADNSVPLGPILSDVRSRCAPGERFRCEGLDITHVQRRLLVKGYGSIVAAGKRLRCVEYDISWEIKDGGMSLVMARCHPSQPVCEERSHG